MLYLVLEQAIDVQLNLIPSYSALSSLVHPETDADSPNIPGEHDDCSSPGRRRLQKWDISASLTT
jgi:hypothetical protein